MLCVHCCVFFFFKQKTAYEMRISDWSSDVCSSDLNANEETEIKVTMLERITDAIAAFSGSLAFLALHVVWFAAWIGLNTIPGLPAFEIGRASCRERGCQYG